MGHAELDRIPQPNPGAAFIVLIDEDLLTIRRLRPVIVMELPKHDLLIPRFSEAHAWAFFVFVDKDDAGILQRPVNFLQVSGNG